MEIFEKLEDKEIAMWGVIVFTLGAFLLFFGANLVPSHGAVPQGMETAKDIVQAIVTVFGILLGGGMTGFGLKLIITDAIKASK